MSADLILRLESEEKEKVLKNLKEFTPEKVNTLIGSTGAYSLRYVTCPNCKEDVYWYVDNYTRSFPYTVFPDTIARQLLASDEGFPMVLVHEMVELDHVPYIGCVKRCGNCKAVLKF